MNIVVFEDDGASSLFPITTGRPAYAISCGGFQLQHWLHELQGNLVGLVRTHLETLQLHDFSHLSNPLNPGLSKTWLINARLVPSISNIQRLIRFRDDHGSATHNVIAKQGWAIASAIVDTGQLFGKTDQPCRKTIDALGDRNGDSTTVMESELDLLEYPHQVVDHHIKTFEENLDHRISIGNWTQLQDGVFVGKDVHFSDHVVFDSSSGPIVIGDRTRIGPFSYMRGPVYIGRDCKISEHASLKDEVAIGHTCKIGGEVETSIIEPFSNKQHHGFLGHSYLGSWVNLGAGTCNSDLKNTYGHVNMQYGERKMATGMQFVGCIAGDYVKTAINTSIFTGKLIGTGSMVYGFATTNVPSFVNYARLFDKIGNLPPEVIVSTQSRMFKRRNVTQRPCDVQLIHDMYRLTESERPAKLSDDPLCL